MGIYDRDYYREPSRRRRSILPNWSMITYIIVINVILFFANGFLLTSDNKEWLTRFLLLDSSTIRHPLYYWKFLTYGFVHDPRGIQHILFNMLGLFFLGGEVERRLGSREFLRFYLATIIFGGIVWSICNINTVSGCLGASGGVVGVCILFALMFPHRTLYFFGVVPIPAWAFAILIVVMDVAGAIGIGHQRVAYAVHIAGAFFAFMYDSYRWNFGRMFDSIKKRLTGGFRRPNSSNRSSSSKKPELNLFKPDNEEDKMSKQVDEVLKKYSRVGESGLTAKEREILKKASNHYQKKHRK